MQFIAENGKITVDNTMTKVEAQERLAKMKVRQTNLAVRIASLIEGVENSPKPQMEARKAALDVRTTNLEEEIAKI